MITDDFLERFEQWKARNAAVERIPAINFFADPKEARNAEQLLSDEETLKRLLGDNEDSPGIDLPPLNRGRFRCDWKKLLGRGGHGEVYLGVDLELGRNVAIKRPRADRISPELKARLVREARIIGRLEHPGVIPIHGGRWKLDDPEDVPFYAMRRYQGKTLDVVIEGYFAEDPARLVAKGPDPRFRALMSHFRSACLTMKYVADQGVLHRDLKPSNIVIGDHGETLVVDWGLASEPEARGSILNDPVEGEPIAIDDALADARSSPTRAGHSLGTTGYRSPEQIAGRWEEVGPASDQFSLGATLFHMLTGRPPFTRDDESQGRTIDQVTQPRSLKKRAPRALAAACRKAMAARPEDRYANVGELASDIQHWLDDQRVLAYHEERWWERSARWVRRNKALAAAIPLILGLVVSLLWLLTTFGLLEQTRGELTQAAQRRDQAVRLAGEAEQQRAEALQAADEAERRRLEAVRAVEASYPAGLQRAEAAIERGDYLRAADLLTSLRTDQERVGLRVGFEWGALLRRARFEPPIPFPVKHKAEIVALHWSFEHDELISLSADGILIRWNPEAREPIGESELKVWTQPPRETAGQNAGLLRDQRRLLMEKGHQFDPDSLVAFRGDGRRVAVGVHRPGEPPLVEVFDVLTGRFLRVIPQPKGDALDGVQPAVTALAFSHDGTKLITAFMGKRYHVYDMETGELWWSPREQAWSGVAVDGGAAMSPDGRTLYATQANPDGLGRWEEIEKRPSRAKPIWDPLDLRHGQRLEVSRDATILLSQGRSGAAIYPLGADRSAMPLRHEGGQVVSSAIDLGGRLVATAGFDRSLRVWSARTGTPLWLHRIPGSRAPRGLTIAPGGRSLVVTNGLQMIQYSITVPAEDIRLGKESSLMFENAIEDPRTRRLLISLNRPLARTPYEFVEIDPGNLTTSRAWSMPTAFPGLFGTPALSPNGQMVAVASVPLDAPAARLFVRGVETEDKTVPVDVAIPLSLPQGVEWSPDGQEVLVFQADYSAGRDKGRELIECQSPPVWAYSLERRAWRIALQAYRPIGGIRFSPDGQRLAVTQRDAVLIHEWPSGKLLRRIILPDALSRSLAWSPDGGTIAFARGGEGEFEPPFSPVEVLVVNANEGRVLAKCEGLRGACTLNGIAFSLDGKRLAGGSAAGVLLLWDAATGKVIQQVVQNQKEKVSRFITGVENISKDGTSFVTWTNSAGLYDISLGAPAQPGGMLIHDWTTGRSRPVEGQRLPHALPSRGARVGDRIRIATSIVKSAELRVHEIGATTSSRSILEPRALINPVLGPVDQQAKIALAASPKRERFAWSRRDGVIQLFDASENRLLRRWTAEQAGVIAESLAFWEDEELLIAAGRGTVITLNPRDGATTPLLRVEGLLDQPDWSRSRRCELADDGSHVAFLLDGDPLRVGVWPLKPLGLPRYLEVTGVSGAFVSPVLAVSAGWDWIALAVIDESRVDNQRRQELVIHCWNLVDGRTSRFLARTWSGSDRVESEFLTALAISPDGERVVGRWLGTGKVTLWSRSNGAQLLEFPGVEGNTLPVAPLFFTRDGEKLVIGAGSRLRVLRTVDNNH